MPSQINRLWRAQSQGASQVFSKVEMGEPPVVGIAKARGKSCDLRRLVWGQGDIEIGQRNAQPVPECFDDGLFPRPAPKERLGPCATGQRRKRFVLRSRKEAMGDAGFHAPVRFDIETEIDRSIGDGQGCPTAGVAEVEAWTLGQMGLSMASIGKLQFGWGLSHPRTQDFAQSPTTNSIGLAMVRPNELRRTRFFLRRQECGQTLRTGGRQGPDPKIDGQGFSHSLWCKLRTSIATPQMEGPPTLTRPDPTQGGRS